MLRLKELPTQSKGSFKKSTSKKPHRKKHFHQEVLDHRAADRWP